MSKLDVTRRKLTALEVKKAKSDSKLKKLADGYGLFLEVRTNGGKYWRYNYRLAGKHRTLTIGAYPEVSLAQARQAHEKAYFEVKDGLDPAAEKKASQLTDQEAASNTFGAVAFEWLEKHMADKTHGHRVRTERFITKHLAKLKSRPIASITTPELVAELEAIEAKGILETAHRTRHTAKQVFAHAVQTGRVEHNIARELDGVLRTPKKRHMAAITDPAKLGKLLRDMEHSNARIVVKTAMLLSPMLFQRPGEIRQMEWQELDLEKGLWVLPAEKMKMRRAHIVPLPKQAIELLEELHYYTGGGKYVFPSARGGSRCLSDNGVRTALRDLGYTSDQVTPHGFRATARTLLDEVLGFRVDYIEHQLAHAVKDPTGRAYNRTSFLKQRTEMMQTWANFLDKLKTGGEVIELADYRSA